MTIITKAARLIFAACLAAALAVTSASAATYVFDETSATQPGFVAGARITINGGFADLPTLDNTNPAPSSGYDFGNLQALDVTVPSLADATRYTLVDFTARCPFSAGASCRPANFPQWTISPRGISFINAGGSSDFFLTFSPATLQFDSDRPTNPPACERTGACVAQGVFSLVPEPATAMPLIAGLLGAVALRGRRSRRLR